jgi:dTDP-4-dehydrorhamnose reductase
VTILVLGRSGQVAQALLESSIGEEAPFRFMGRETCDLADARALEQAIIEIAPSAIINAAAYTAVDAAETDEANARAINVTGPALAAKLAAEAHIPFVHLSTDYVFDGTKTSPYVETDPTNPINIYGLTKRDGEIAILANHANAVILRTSWVYSPTGKNFLRTMLTLAQSRDALSIVDDQMGAPTSANDIAHACRAIVDAKLGGATAKGIFHMTGGGQTTWLGFAQAAFAQTAHWRGGAISTLTSVATSAYPTPARRPLNSRLNCDLLEAEFGIRLPYWELSLRDTLGVLKNEFGAQ